MFVPTRRLALVIVLTAPAWFFGASVGFVVAAAIVFAVMADAVLIPNRSRLEIARHLAPAIGVGDELDGTYVLHSRWPAAVRGVVYDALPDGVTRVGKARNPLEVAGGGLAFTVPGRGEATVPMRLMGRERGEWALGRVALRAAGPLGLIARTLRYTLDDKITVAPSLANARRFRLLAIQHRLREAGVRALRRRGEGTSFAGLREYAVGDDPRMIDWKATARRQRMITREFSIEQGQTVMIVVDAGRLMTQQAADFPRFEYALSSALVLADIVVASGDQVGLMVFNDELRAFVPPGRGAAAVRAVREALIPVRATMIESDYTMAFRTLDTRQRRRSLVVIFTDVIDPRSSHALITHTTRSARRHLPLVVALRNESLVKAAIPLAEPTLPQVYTTAAAEELLSAREEALAQMRHAGVSVVDVRPQMMAAAVVNKYLELKGKSAI